MTQRVRMGMMTCYMFQAAQATFKSIKSLVPLFDRVLVQRFKPETVRDTHIPLFPYSEP